ncbi:cell wall hydrolase [Sphingosinicella sp.]|uniref:cell wall hydrolase n=1 Tax=Sphingosinicella sp. TaxID=1917971 RepID=UPI00403815EE
MRFPFRAAALSAVILSCCAAVAVADPSVASEADATPTVSYIEHAASGLTAENLGLNDLDDSAPAPTPQPEALQPVATHAMAPAFPERAPAFAAPEREERRSLADLVGEHASADTLDGEHECLARAVYYESQGEPLIGQLSVAEVIINRSRSGRFASNICGVVRQAGQFSFVRRGHIPQPPQSARNWRTAVAIARIAMADLADSPAPRALFFHARRVNPGWRLRRVATVGNHVFYR